MITKTCSKCKLDKDVSEFSKNKRKKDGLNTFCRVCNTAYQAQWYKDNREKHIKTTAEKKAKYRIERYLKIDAYLAAHPCVDCGESDPDVLEFDHVRGEKEDCISTMVRDDRPWKFIEAEITKCDVRCANHHRKRHAIERKEKWAAPESNREPSP